ncbi:UDP binding domain-containing protein [Arachidicoccus ginsenosidivorans]|uniref:UDP binding domain-containing protein n=1 Tax=Arachidicoccus ginsenosidivorans TaxID=496057 RepID=UPI00293914BE|nr:UDP binding domain-containing protein [Arachidicoccus ginsenosidivorans]
MSGGHCIGVDPYYLAQKAQEFGYHPEIILSGRRINDSMGEYIANEFVRLLIKNEILVKNCRVLILGITFKEDCPDVRNTKVVDILKCLSTFGVDLTIFDPWADPKEVKREYNIDSENSINKIDANYDGIILAVAHADFHNLDFGTLLKENGVLYDVKGLLNNNNLVSGML